MKIAKRMGELRSSELGKILARVSHLKAEGRQIIAMHAGEPDFPTPENIVAAAIKALRDGETHYVSPVGIPTLRETIAAEVARTRQISVNPGRVIVAPGAKLLIYYAIQALCEPGDEVICVDPVYPFYALLSEYTGAKVVSLPMTMETGFSFDIERLRSLITQRTRMIVINSPSNPTGGMLIKRDLQALAEVAIEHDLIILSDEIYGRIVYDQPFESIASVAGMDQRVILVDGFSKTYAMTGWRLGYAVVPDFLVGSFTKLVLSSITCTNAFVQVAGIEAIRGPQDSVDKMVETFRMRRDLTVDTLNRIPGFNCLKPQGAFYAFPRIDDIGLSSAELCRHLLDTAGVATYPGSAFGNHGEGFIRFSFACSEKDIREGLDRVAKAMAAM